MVVTKAGPAAEAKGKRVIRKLKDLLDRVPVIADTADLPQKYKWLKGQRMLDAPFANRLLFDMGRGGPVKYGLCWLIGTRQPFLPCAPRVLTVLPKFLRLPRRGPHRRPPQRRSQDVPKRELQRCRHRRCASCLGHGK